METFVKVIAIDRFLYAGRHYQAGVLYEFEMETAKKLAMDGRVKLYTGSGSVFNNQVKKAQRPTVVINLEYTQDSGIFK